MKMNMNKLMQQVQETQKRIQDELSAMRVTAASGGGMVEVTLDGTKQMIAIKIDPQVAGSDDIEMLQDLIVAAYNEAFRKAEEEASQKMSALTGGLKIPGMGNLF